jgi:hypothetical protein
MPETVIALRLPNYDRSPTPNLFSEFFRLSADRNRKNRIAAHGEKIRNIIEL